MIVDATAQPLDDSATDIEAEAGPGVDIAVICTNHTAFSYADLPTHFPLVLDTRNALKGVSGANIFRL